MSGFDNYSDVLDDDGRQEQTGGALRKQLEDALKEIKELRAELSQDKRESTVAGLLETKGLDPAVAQLIPTDADPNKWLEDFGHLFGKNLDEAPPQPDAENKDPELDAEQQALQQVQNVASAGDTSSTVTNDDPLQKLNAASTEAELLALLSGGNANGGGVFR